MPRRPRASPAPSTVTLGMVIAELLPFGSNPTDFAEPEDGSAWNKVPWWAPDLFAVVATLAERSGLYSEAGIALSTSSQGRARKRSRAAAAETLGAAWSRNRGEPPPQVQTLWARLLTHADDGLCTGAGTGGAWKRAAMQLLAIADEAAAGIGFRPAGTEAELAAFVFEEYQTLADMPAELFLPALPNSLARAVPPDRACVLPKALTPEIGCTLRSTTHNLALLPGIGEVSAEWRLSDVPSARRGKARAAAVSERFNLLVVPFPYHLADDAFRVSRPPDAPDVDGYFELSMNWLPPGAPPEQAAALVEFIVALIAAAEAEAGPVQAMILPETALRSAEAETVALAVAKRCPGLEMVIAGVIAPPPPYPRAGVDRPFARNAAYVARFDAGRRIDQYQQAKHHRWRLDAWQIRGYGLGHVLDPAHGWWEQIDLSNRRMVFSLDAREAVVAALICEDLARYDPVLPVLSAIGPNLVVALLMDGPQLAHRWPARHATVLADDPGSSVLTVTSLGMVARSNREWLRSNPGAAGKPRDCVAMWKERGKSAQGFDLAEGSHALMVSLAATPRLQKTLDLRKRRDSGGLIEYQLVDVKNIAMPDSERFSWLAFPTISGP